ncbi:VOC family protein [Clostridium sp. DL1XJH146]
MIGMEHVGICANNTTELKDWYVKLFGFEVVYDNKKEKPTYFLWLDDGNMIEIYAADEDEEVYGNNKKGIRHLAFSTDDIEKEYKNLMDNKVEIVKDFAESAKGIKTVFFRDLEGNIIHFISRPEEQKLKPKA